MLCTALTAYALVSGMDTGRMEYSPIEAIAFGIVAKAYAIEVRDGGVWATSQGLAEEITKSKIVILSVSCAKSNAVNYPKAGVSSFYLFLFVQC